MAALTKSFPVSAGIQHREVINDYDIDKVGVGEWTEGGLDINHASFSKKMGYLGLNVIRFLALHS